jgi:hypothetical protein
MSRARRIDYRFILLAACFAGLLVAVDPSFRFEARVSAEQSPNIHLTHTQSRAVMAVPAAVLQRASLLILPITQITNETLTPVSVHAYFTWSVPTDHRPARLLLGQISVYPANQPGTFTIRLPQEFQDLLKQSPDFQQRSPSLVLELRPLHSQVLPPMDLTIGPVQWRTVEANTGG